MITEQDQWLGIVRPLLGGIKTNATWAKYHAREIADKVGLLPYVPEFETLAQSELDSAIQELTEAVEKLRAAKLAYAGKPSKV